MTYLARGSGGEATNRSAVSSPHLDLSFRRHPVHGTWLDRRLFRWPYTLSRSFPTGDRLMLILQTVSGTIQADDRLAQRFHIGPGADVHIATQGAMPVHRARGGRAAEDDVMLEVADGGSIEYRPDLRILFPNSSLSQRVCVRIADTGTAVVADGFVMHSDGTGHSFRDYQSELLVQGADGRLLAVDRTALPSAPGSRGQRARYRAFGTLLVAANRPAAWVEALCADANARLADLPNVYAAASALPNGAGATVRIAATDGRHLRLGLEAGWRAARLQVAGNAGASRGHPSPDGNVGEKRYRPV